MFRWCACVVVFIAVGAGAARADKVPRWVTLVERPDAVMPEGNEEWRTQVLEDHIRFHGGQKTRVHREVYVLGSEEAIEYGGTHTYGPNDEVHYMRVIRDGRVVGSLADAKRTREDDLLVVELPDVRVGDQIDYAVSFVQRVERVTGVVRLPSFGIAADRRVLTLTVPQDLGVVVKMHGGGSEPAVGQGSREVQYTWDVVDMPGPASEAGTPDWYPDAPTVQYSDMQSWAELGAWLAPRFSVPDEPTPGVAARARDIADAHPTATARALAATRFVQREIERSYPEGMFYERPIAEPDDVLATGSGDVYAQARALVALLRALDVEADVALASEARGGTIAFWLAGPEAFDTAVVRYRIGGEEHWIDPTHTYARGAEPERLRLERALLLQQPEARLFDVPSPRVARPEIDVHETYRIVGTASQLEVLTTFRGRQARLFRGRLAHADLEEMGQAYLEALAMTNPGIRAVGPPTVEDDEAANVIRLVERYRLSSYWPDGVRRHYPTEVYNNMTLDDEESRTTPLAIDHPVHVRHAMSVEIPPGAFSPGRSADNVANPFFALEFRAVTSDDRVEVSWTYRSKTTHIMPDDLPAYRQAIAEVDNVSGYELRLGHEAPGDPRYWVKVLAIVGAVLALGVVGQVVARRRTA